jgi:predicted metal-binding protein
MDMSTNNASADSSALTRIAKECGADKAEPILTESIEFSVEFKNLCRSNSCGKYGSNWMCPPGVGPIEEQIARVRPYRQGIVVQNISQLEDSFDLEGMGNALDSHNAIFRNIRDRVQMEFKGENILFLSAGACTICERCTYMDSEPCLFPDLAIPPIESYGIDVYKVLSSSGLKYNNGKDTVSNRRWGLPHPAYSFNLFHPMLKSLQALSYVNLPASSDVIPVISAIFSATKRT